jgi:hypothetical protein
MKRGLFCLVNSRPKLHKGLWTIQTMGHGIWASRVFGIPQSWRALVNHVLLLSLSQFTAGHTSLRKLPQKSGATSSSFIHWLVGYHINRLGRSILWTLPGPGDMCLLWHHNQAFSLVRLWSTPAKVPLPPHTNHFGASNRQELLIWRGSSPPVSFLTFSRFNWDDIPLLFHTTTNLEAAFWRTGSVSTGEYKNTSSPLQCNQPGKFP